MGKYIRYDVVVIKGKLPAGGLRSGRGGGGEIGRHEHRRLHGRSTSGAVASLAWRSHVSVSDTVNVETRCTYFREIFKMSAKICST